MSLYGGLGLGLDKNKAAALSKAKQGGNDDSKAAAVDDSSKPSWGSSIKMMAPSLRRKQMTQQQRKTPDEVKAKLSQLRKAAAAGAAPAKTTVVVMSSTNAANVAVSGSGSTAEPFLQGNGQVEYKDEYHPKRPNDYDSWTAIFEKENAAQRREKQESSSRERESQRRKLSKNTAAIAPPSSLVGEMVAPAPASTTLFSSTKLHRPKPVDDIESQNPFDSGSDDGGNGDPFANMPMTGFGAAAGAGPAEAAAPKPAAASLQMSGSDAWAARARISNPRANMIEQGRAPQLQNNVGAKMMEKYGWQDGKGLGLKEQGLNTALSVEQTGSRQGVIVNEASRPLAAPPAAPSTNYGPARPAPIARPSKPFQSTVEPAAKPSRVMLLMNLVGPGEVDAELRGETADECSKFGTVVKCVVHECAPNTRPPEETVRIFVEFASAEGAKKAVKVMNGRVFGGRTVYAQYYDLSRYLRGFYA